MTHFQTLDIVQTDVQVLHPAINIQAATGLQAELARPWATMSEHSDFDVVTYRDGGQKHAPEVVTALNAMCATKAPPQVLIFAHRGHQIECMMPLLPSLLNAVDYRGPAQALRMDPDACETTTLRQIKRFALGLLDIGNHALLVEDRQERIGPKGSLTANAVVLSRFVLLAEPNPQSWKR